MLSVEHLSPKKRILLSQSLDDFDARWDEEYALLKSWEDGVAYHGTRESVFYALALLIRRSSGDVERAVRILHTVLSLQFLDPTQLWHGTFRYGPEYAAPPRSPFDTDRLSPEARWQGDVLWERVCSAFMTRLQAKPFLSPEAESIGRELSAALTDVFPVVWKTYDPNWREFILSSFALILEEFDTLLPAETVQAMEAAARAGIAGARSRTEKDLTPLNTNVKVMHVFCFDAFARRFHDQNLADYISGFASRFLRDYRQYHAVCEFNSPTYNGVVLSYTGLLRSRGGSPAVRELGVVLEEGLWEDLADFYNPAMETLCGPFSRAYGMTIDGTALPMLMYLCFDSLPVETPPPFGPETESACILCCSEPAIPAAVQKNLTESRGERQVRRLFRELAERGKPGDNHALCTATAWITDSLMLGAMKGSANTSHQLHACTVHWRNSGGTLSGLRLRRRTADGQLIHLRTVFLDLTAEPGRIFGTVRNDSALPVVCNFEIESPHAASGVYQEENWQVDGLHCRPAFRISGADGASRRVIASSRILQEDQVWCNIPLLPGETLNLDLSFSLDS